MRSSASSSDIFREKASTSWSRKVFEQIAEIAIEYKTGARSLRGIFEELITPILYVVTDRPDIGQRRDHLAVQRGRVHREGGTHIAGGVPARLTIPLGNIRLLLAMGGIALLGNGLKSVVTSTVLVSEARFASFLGIEVERVALLMEAIVAGMVVALAMYPLVVRRFAVRDVALAAAVIGALAFAAFAAGATDGAGRTREAWAYTCLTLGGAALVWLAPGAQSLVLGWPGTDGRKALTSIWTGATPAGFLAAPQLAKWLLPGLGLSAYFASLAILPLAFAALVATTAIAAQRPDGDDALPVRLVVAFAAAVVTFEAWSTAGSVLGYTAAATLATLPLLAAAAAWFVKRARQSSTSI